MSSFNGSEYISCILNNNENTSSDNYMTRVKTTHLTGQCRVTVVASLPTNQSHDVTANNPIQTNNIMIEFIRRFLQYREHKLKLF